MTRVAERGEGVVKETERDKTKVRGGAEKSYIYREVNGKQRQCLQGAHIGLQHSHGCARGEKGVTTQGEGRGQGLKGVQGFYQSYPKRKITSEKKG